MVSWVRGKCIGKGSFGAVSLGVNVQDGGAFAVKSVDMNSCHPGHLDALENEIRVLRSLSSPYVVGFIGDDVTYESPTTSYRNLHMEYLPGGTVADVAERCLFGDDVEWAARSYAFCVVSALRYLHCRGIVHGDVKGRNVLVGPGLNTAKLADFGSAIDDTCTAPVLPRGSPLWMAPEVIRRESQGKESDVWSLGCTVIEMITGKPAWKDEGLETLSRIGYSDKLPEFPISLSELGRDFIEKCLRRDPSKRWSCDRLLQHPFLSSASPNSVADPSPRCVLDWANSEFNDDDDNDESYEASAKERIGKLATTVGANWESEGWMVVRDLAREREGVATGGSGSSENEGEGTSTEYLDLMRTEEETTRTTSFEFAYSDSVGTSMEFSYPGGGNLLGWVCNNTNYCACGLGCGGCKAGSSCRYGSQKADFAVENIIHGTTTFYSVCCVLLLCLFPYCLTVMNKILFIFFAFYSWPHFYPCDSCVISKKYIQSPYLFIFMAGYTIAGLSVNSVDMNLGLL